MENFYGGYLGSYFNAGAGGCCPRQGPCQMGQNPCVPPVHNETVAVPHHIYTVHSQPQINRWMTNEVGCTQTPVTQEVRTQQHQTLDSCNGR
jgi:hypothetical protein